MTEHTKPRDTVPGSTGQTAPGSGSRRILVLVCAALDCFMLGTIYLYSVFQPFVMDYFSAESSSASLAFTLSWMFMTFAQFIAGALHRRIGVKATAVAGLALMAAGCVVCSLLPVTMLGVFTVVYCTVIGLGLGLAYNTIAATVVRWFPGNKGVATSIALGMMGAAGIVLSPAFASLLAHSGMAFSLQVQALLFAPCIVFTLLVFKDAPSELSSVGKGGEQVPANIFTGIRALLRTRDAWLLAVLYFSIAPVYLIASAVFVSFGEMGKGIDPSTAAWFVSAAAICQIVGRFIMPSASDYVGRRVAFTAVLALTLLAAMGLVFVGGTFYAVAFCVLSFAYGGGVTAMPAIVSDRLGTANATQNIAFSELGTLGASLFTSVIINILPIGTTLGLTGVFCCALGILVLALIYSPKRGK